MVVTPVGRNVEYHSMTEHHSGDSISIITRPTSGPGFRHAWSLSNESLQYKKLVAVESVYERRFNCSFKGQQTVEL